MAGSGNLCTVALAVMFTGGCAETLPSVEPFREVTCSQLAKISLKEAVATAEAAGELNYLPELRRIHGEVFAAVRRDAEEAEALLLGALEAARKRGTLLFELRCALSIHRLRSLSRTGGAGNRLAQARDVVAALRARFTEGFDTPDLVDADRLLATQVP